MKFMKLLAIALVLTTLSSMALFETTDYQMVKDSDETPGSLLAAPFLAGAAVTEAAVDTVDDTADAVTDTDVELEELD